MINMILLVILFFFLLLFPLIYAFYQFKKTEADVLFINSSYVREPRYFSKSFRKMFDTAWTTYTGNGIIKISKQESLIEADKTRIDSGDIINAVIYSESKDFVPPPHTAFNKEIYVCQNTYLQSIPLIRAIACKKEIVVVDDINILRWADAEGRFSIDGHADLGISTSSATQLHLHKTTLFKRLYAPEIIFKRGCADKGLPLKLSDISSKIMRDIQYVDMDLDVDEYKCLDATIVTKHSLEVLKGYTIKGHIRCYSDLRLHNYSVIWGNIFCEGNVWIGSHSKIYGSVFCEKSIYVEHDVCIGQKDKIKSLIARESIEITGDCTVYGYISAEERGSSI